MSSCCQDVVLTQLCQLINLGNFDSFISILKYLFWSYGNQSSKFQMQISPYRVGRLIL